MSDTATTTITSADDIKQRLLEKFEVFEDTLEGRANSFIHAIRREALESFSKMGFPTTKNEEWKYTNILPAIKGKVDFRTKNKTSAIAPEDIEKVNFKDLKANVLVFINGIYSPYSSTVLTPVHEMEILNFTAAEEKRVSDFDDNFGRYASYKDDAFTALNTAFAENGTFIYVPEEKEVELPVILHYISDVHATSVVSQPRNLFVVGKGAKVCVVETYSSIGNESSFTNSVTEVLLGEGAEADYVMLQNENENASQVNTTEVLLNHNSKLNCVTVTLNGAIIRNNLNLRVKGENVEANMYGLYMANGKTHVDNHTLADHVEPNSVSNELYKGIVGDQATAVFNGKIFVKAEAQKTNAFQSNRNILLSDDATVNTKPQLEIFADDVRCSHGATTGALDKEPMFYLQSRGLSKESAYALLLHAFAADVIDKIRIDAVRETILALIDKRLEETSQA